MSSVYINQFRVESEIPLPCDNSLAGEGIGHNAPVIIKRDSLTHLSLLRGLRQKRFRDVGDGILADLGLLQMHVSYHGDCILVDFSDEALPHVAPRILNVGLSLCTYIQGGLPLHGSGIELDGKFIAVVADSGTGKSTTAWHLLQSGALFGNDDLIPLLLRDNQVLAFPSLSLFPKLRIESLNHSSTFSCPATETFTASGEFWMRIKPSQRILHEAPLAAVFLLEPNLADENISAERISRAAAAVSLLQFTHGIVQVARFVGAKRLTDLTSTVAEQVPFFALCYPKSFDALPHLINTMRSCL